jgi:predicted transcriptional regulator
LANVEHGDGGGLVGEVAGQAVAGRLDETVLDANLLGNPAVQVAVVAAGAVLVGLLGFLFSRTTADAALDNPKRRLIHQLIGANPGIAYRELIRLSDLPAGTARHHLLKLEEMKLVRAIRHGNHVRYFVGDPQGQSLDAIAATRDPELRALLGWIHGAPLVTQKTILEQTLNWGWSRATTQNRLKRLVESGLLIGQREGREIRYAAAGE